MRSRATRHSRRDFSSVIRTSSFTAAIATTSKARAQNVRARKPSPPSAASRRASGSSGRRFTKTRRNFSGSESIAATDLTQLFLQQLIRTFAHIVGKIVPAIWMLNSQILFGAVKTKNRRRSLGDFIHAARFEIRVAERCVDEDGARRKRAEQF